MTVNEPLTHFCWDVPLSGYRWLDVPDEQSSERARSGRYLVPADGGGGPHRRTYPLRERRFLHRELAAVVPAEASILTFACESGWLRHTSVLTLESDAHRPQPPVGESLDDWAAQIAALRTCVDLWDALIANERSTLVAFMEVEDAQPLDVLSEMRGNAGPFLGFSSTVFEFAAYGEGDVANVLRSDYWTRSHLVLVEQINTHLRATSSPQLVFNASDAGASHRLVPRNLLGAAWLALMAEVESGRVPVRCAFCDKPIIGVVPAVRRRQRKFCDNNGACKAADYRKRQAEARVLAQRGMTARAIAEQVGAREPTVARWLTGLVPDPGTEGERDG